MLNKKTERSFQVFEHLNAINVMWTDIIFDDETEISRGQPRARSFCKTERDAFLEAVPDGAAYADLAGLVDPEPVAAEVAAPEQSAA
jgi:hypothetical protein